MATSFSRSFSGGLATTSGQRDRIRSVLDASEFNAGKAGLAN